MIKQKFASFVFNSSLAEKSLEKNYAKNRPKNKKSINIITQDMINNSFYSYAPIIYVWCAGKMLLVDGQHRLMAVMCAATRKIDFSIKMPVVVFIAENSDDIETIFSFIDKGKPRTVMNFLNATGLKDIKFSDSTSLKQIQAAISFLCSRTEFFNDGSINPTDGLKVQVKINAYMPQIEQYLELISNCKYDDVKKQLKKAPVFGVFIIALKHNPVISEKFILELINNPTGTTLTLRNWLSCNNTLHGGNQRIISAGAVTYYFNKYDNNENNFTTKRTIEYFKKNLNRIVINGYNDKII